MLDDDVVEEPPEPVDVEVDPSDFELSDFELSDFESAPVDDDDAFAEPSVDSDFVEVEAAVDVAFRSFLAQPEPLKWIVGGAKAFRTVVEWQIGHSVGPAASIPWTTSKRWPWSQTYS